MTNPTSNISEAVARLYDTYPFPPEPLLDEPPPGYNWRWNWPAAYHFATGQKPRQSQVRILDAGCGTGVSTEYLVHLNPEAEVVGIDLSGEAIAVAKERCRRTGADRAQLHHLSLYDTPKLEGEFDYINCVGVLHHLPDPQRGLHAIASKLAPGGLMHVFVYAELGRWEVRLMQQALALLQGDNRNDFQSGVKLGRQIFDSLPENNRIVKREKQRWSLENQRDANFADMYLNPQEIDYNIETLFELIDASQLQFLGFSNSDYWQLDRLLGNAPDALEKAKQLDERQQYRLIELLDPEVSHYEFFLGRPPIPQNDWSSPAALEQAIPERSPCMFGWCSRDIMDYNYMPVTLSEAEFEFMQACDGQRTVGEILPNCALDSDGVRSLARRQLILLGPSS
jgi:SAM-dependent methyltransferase